MVLLNINAIETPDSQEYQPIPEGWYNCWLSQSEVRTGKTSGQDYLSLEFTVATGTYASRRFWGTYALWNDNPDVVKWAQEKLGKLATALQMQTIEDHQTLEGHELEVKVGLDKQGKNEPKYFRSRGNTPPAAPADSNGKQKPAWA